MINIKQSLFLNYCDVNNLYGWTIPLKLYVFLSRLKIHLNLVNLDFVENYNKDSDEGYFLEVDVQYSEKKYINFHNNLPFLLEWMKIETVQKISSNLHDKKEYVIHITKLKEALNHKLKLHRVIKFNKKLY